MIPEKARLELKLFEDAIKKRDEIKTRREKPQGEMSKIERIIW